LKRRSGKKFIALFLVLFLGSCKTPPVPPEVERAKAQENDLWRAGALLYAPEEYARYLETSRAAKNELIKQKAKIGWFRKYQDVQAAYRGVLAEGEEILRKVQQEKDTKSKDFGRQLEFVGGRIAKLKRVILKMNENGLVRKSLVQAEVLSQEAELMRREEKFTGLSEKIRAIEAHLSRAEEEVFSILARYADESQVERWRAWAEETIAESRRRGGAAIIVTKFDRRLTLYQKGVPKAVFNIGLGKFGLSDKLYAGDEATPEGRYKIVKKNPSSRFYKALLIDYPNEKDRREFAEAKKKGLIPAGRGIGGLIEIHGGGNDSLTNGCIALENEAMDALFSEVGIGTPVTIVGTLESAAELLASLKHFEP